MDKVSAVFVHLLQTSGMFAPFAFILLHLARQFVFVPVSLICMIGGVFFGAVYGTVYSVIGLTLASICFYFFFKRSPAFFKKLGKWKKKAFRNRRPLSFGQMAILRLIPFVHFHLISLCIIEAASGFKDYTKHSFYANVPLAFFYTACGQWIGRLSPETILVVFAVLFVLFYLLRKREWIVKWDDFFHYEKAS
ncbi:MAG TPA: VTT domain-containing protein [Bacillales bacterium]|nr:VTT domain-containing protein [Bacillales bacterium]